MALMVAYVVGLALPFLLAALLMDRATPLLRALGRHQRAVSLAGGGLVMLMGILVMADRFTIFNDFLSAHLPAFFQDPFHL
jgi:cytochrome c-type biogenesis protein